MPAISPARKAAFEILLAVQRSESHADDLLRSKKVDALSPPDRNLATALVLGVLRWQIRLDEQIRPLLKHPNAKLDVEVRISLRLGAFQLMHLDRIPAHAAIDESVELAKRAGHRFASGMVNAVLRKVVKVSAPPPTITIIELNAAGKEVPAAAPVEIPSAPNAVTELAIAQAHPAWMVERWIANYGIEAARSICVHGQAQPVLSVRISGAVVESELEHAGIELNSGTLLTAARTVISGDVTSAGAIHEGRARIQDEGSQLVGELAACAAEGRNQELKNVLDACAAPGGKTLILAERNPQARIVACEASELRLAGLRERLAGYADRVECRLADAGALDEESVFDLALADVPCSGTGTLGRNPEIRHRLRVGDFARHAERQRTILRAALRAVRPGGFVVYSTCSLEPEENEQVVAAVLAEMPDARQVSLAGRIEALGRDGFLAAGAVERLQSGLTAEGALRLLPGNFPTDGFFVALIEKTNRP